MLFSSSKLNEWSTKIVKFIYFEAAVYLINNLKFVYLRKSRGPPSRIARLLNKVDRPPSSMPISTGSSVADRQTLQVVSTNGEDEPTEAAHI